MGLDLRRSTDIWKVFRLKPLCPPGRSHVWVKKNVQRWWNDTDRGKVKCWERHRAECHCVHHKSHMDCSGIEPGTPQRDTDD